MFTGIIEETGRVKQIKKASLSALLEIEAKKVLEDIKIGDSISTNGVCLTVTRFDQNIFTADVMNETLKASNLGDLNAGCLVNLERAAQLNTRLGGHLMSGHIDGVGKIMDVRKVGVANLYRIKTFPELLKYMIKKGSVALDGISLTIQDLEEDSFQVSIIPHTENQTNLISKKPGDTVNIETDLLAKYTERLLGFSKADEKRNLTMNDLIKQGFI